MNDKNLKQHLENLKKEIANINEQDPAVRAKLQELAATIQQKLDNPKDAAEHNAVVSHLKEDMIAFKVKYPRLSTALERLIEMLKNMGI